MHEVSSHEHQRLDVCFSLSYATVEATRHSRHCEPRQAKRLKKNELQVRQSISSLTDFASQASKSQSSQHVWRKHVWELRQANGQHAQRRCRRSRWRWWWQPHGWHVRGDGQHGGWHDENGGKRNGKIRYSAVDDLVAIDKAELEMMGVKPGHAAKIHREGVKHLKFHNREVPGVANNEARGSGGDMAGSGGGMAGSGMDGSGMGGTGMDGSGMDGSGMDGSGMDGNYGGMPGNKHNRHHHHQQQRHQQRPHHGAQQSFNGGFGGGFGGMPQGFSGIEPQPPAYRADPLQEWSRQAGAAYNGGESSFVQKVKDLTFSSKQKEFIQRFPGTILSAAAMIRVLEELTHSSNQEFALGILGKQFRYKSRSEQDALEEWGSKQFMSIKRAVAAALDR